MKFLVIGSINVDSVLFVDKFVQPGETISAIKQEKFLGGKGLNQAISLAKTHDDVYLYANVNKSDTYLVDEIAKLNVKTDYINFVVQETGSAYIQVNNEGENSIVISKNANGVIDLIRLKEVLLTLSDTDYVFLQNEINNLKEILVMLKELSIKVIFNPSPITDEITLDLLSGVHYLIMNEGELNKISFNKGIDYLEEIYPDVNFLVTKGSNGASFYSDKEVVFEPSLKVDVVDTTCAGDTFLGYFMSSILNAKDVETSLKIATKASSICVGIKGASVSIPNKEDL